MNIYALICTRSDKLSLALRTLACFYEDCGVSVKLLIGMSSIFDAYNKGFTHINPSDDDIIILCHDDLVIRDTHERFIASLMTTKLDGIGFIGLAGSTKLPEHAVWWRSDRELLSGQVTHVDPAGSSYLTYYGPIKEVQVLDGLFLAATAKVIRTVGLRKPEYFPGEWDFYDIHYTYRANKLGYKNTTVPLDVIHESRGELAGRDSWHKNREAFIKALSLP